MSLLAQPLDIRGHSLPSRIVMAPMATGASDDEGRVGPNMVEYYRRRAAFGGIGAIIVEHAFVDPIGRLDAGQLGIHDDACIEGLSRLAAAIHDPGVPKRGHRRPAYRVAQSRADRYSACIDAMTTAAGCGGGSTVGSDGGGEGGCEGLPRSRPPLALIQISHAGSAALPADLRRGLVAPSACIHPGRKRSGNTGIVPRALDLGDIADIVGAFASAARRAAEAGFDGVEVHAAHGYLLDQFYSPLTNRRDDGYGPASVENRARIVCDVIRAVRAAVGKELLVAVRFGPCDYAEGGALASEGPEAASLFVQAGADIVDVSGGIYNFSTHDSRPPGFFRASSSMIREAVDVPVLTAGGVHSPQGAEWLLQTGACDLVGVGRSLMRQPDWAAWALRTLESTPA